MLRKIAFTLSALFALNSPVAGTELDSLFLDMRDAYCTDRCHVNSLSYRNDFEGEVFQHATHSTAQGLGRKVNTTGLHCADCHEDGEVNKKGHGRLTIGKEDCLSCHHVDNRGTSCARCHKDIDAKPMEYKGEPFVHGFGADSDINCGGCHLVDPRSSMKEVINCDKCHHTRPRIDCRGCHEESLTKVYYPRPAQMNCLAWTTGFLHAQHPEAELSCQECHPSREDRARGLGEYQANCGQCHHKEKSDCLRCHQTVYQFFNGKLRIEGVMPIPDKMSRALKCEDCHKPLEGGRGFSEVGEECGRCHNKHYAELLEAQRGVVSSWLDRLRRTSGTPSTAYLWRGGGVNIREEAYGEEPVSNSGLLDFVEQYGLHNFSYSRGILSFLEKGFQDAGLGSLLRDVSATSHDCKYTW